MVISAYKLVSFVLSRASSGKTKIVFYEVKKNQTAMSIAQELEKAGIVADARMFYWYGRLTGRTAKFKSGDYRFTSKMRPGEVMNVIMSGISFGYPLRIPEGYSLRQIAELIDEFRPASSAKFLKICRDKKFIATLDFLTPPQTLEGYLFPNTYLIGRKLAEEEIIRNMYKKYREVFTPELRNRASFMGMSEHQVVTLASIIEKETGAPPRAACDFIGVSQQTKKTHEAAK
jgi:UPF0755 protein